MTVSSMMCHTRFIAAAMSAISLGLVAIGTAQGVPIVYTLTVPSGAFAGGRIGTLTFSANATLVFTFSGDTVNVTPYTKVNHGYQNLIGSATVTIRDGAVATTALFMPGTGIYVGIDNSARGIGFGSGGLAPSDPNFPGNGVAYPAAFVFGPQLDTYDLRSNYQANGGAISCYGFPIAGCPEVPLHTSAGDLVINGGNGSFKGATFSAQIVVPATSTGEAEAGSASRK